MVNGAASRSRATALATSTGRSSTYGLDVFSSGRSARHAIVTVCIAPDGFDGFDWLNGYDGSGSFVLVVRSSGWARRQRSRFRTSAMAFLELPSEA